MTREQENMVGVIARMLHRRGREHSVEDLVQHVYACALAEGVKDEHGVAYVAQLARWRISSLYRRGYETPIDEELLVDLAGVSEDPELESLPMWSGELWEWMWGLTEAQRDVLLAHYVADRSMPEVAATFGLTLNAAKGLRNRGIAQLRKRAQAAA